MIKHPPGKARYQETRGPAISVKGVGGGLKSKSTVKADMCAKHCSYIQVAHLEVHGLLSVKVRQARSIVGQSVLPSLPHLLISLPLCSLFPSVPQAPEETPFTSTPPAKKLLSRQCGLLGKADTV